ncbi:AAA family ATPase [Flavobacterium sp. DG1-102-2]|uniref:AAA family ATPase n=1 Tax=Flavobacterium sp. DG1-102-2 TaxID=3081663 RepID=UPI002948D5AC|nr:AAA family ATPase [Flavobacterium sp. DG1-102-2]MDV6167766.1 AAA family ATPase [Flavobacterium sp. DG1-102-2]
MVNITIKGFEGTSEYNDARILKQIFQASLSRINGEILIIPNATLFGQAVKDIDLIAIGRLENYSTIINTKARTKRFNEYIELDEEMRKVYINDFCFVFETKKHRAEDIQLNGLNLLVRYDNNLKDVTTQSENQKYSLSSFFEDRLNYKPYVCNFIWLRNVSSESIRNLIGTNQRIQNKNNYLPTSFNFQTLVSSACIQNSPFQALDNLGNFRGYPGFSSFNYSQDIDLNKISKVFDLFTIVKNGIGDLTRKKIARITSKLLADQQYAKSIGDKLVIIAGRAGTGKTIKLLTIACDLAINKNARSLILTYNHALVSDIKRTLALADIPDSIDSYSVNISTLHKFFYDILLGFGVGNIIESPNGKKYIPDFINSYKELLKELYSYIENGLINETDIQNLMDSRQEQVSWDFILIDEAQDWEEIEKNVIFKIFGSQKVIIADGVDQLIRGQKKCNWTEKMRLNDFQKTNEKRGLRQKVNLVNFVNELAKKLDINWSLEPKEELIGGNIIIRTKPYDKALHEEVYNSCVKNGNSAYEMMFLVPPNLVKKEKTKDKYGHETICKSFAYLENYKNDGINLWDGTNSDLRSEYVVDLDEHRILQYESCRGLEGWSVVCLDFDDFIKYKTETYEEENLGELALETYEEKRNRFVYLWALIPMTRAIDTLVITLQDKNSYIGKMLKEIHDENPDFIRWE